MNLNEIAVQEACYCDLMCHVHRARARRRSRAAAVAAGLDADDTYAEYLAVDIQLQSWTLCHMRLCTGRAPAATAGRPRRQRRRRRAAGAPAHVRQQAHGRRGDRFHPAHPVEVAALGLALPGGLLLPGAPTACPAAHLLSSAPAPWKRTICFLSSCSCESPTRRRG